MISSDFLGKGTYAYILTILWILDLPVKGLEPWTKVLMVIQCQWSIWDSMVIVHDDTDDDDNERSSDEDDDNMQMAILKDWCWNCRS